MKKKSAVNVCVDTVLDFVLNCVPNFVLLTFILDTRSICYIMKNSTYNATFYYSVLCVDLIHEEFLI